MASERVVRKRKDSVPRPDFVAVTAVCENGHSIERRLPVSLGRRHYRVPIEDRAIGCTECGERWVAYEVASYYDDPVYQVWARYRDLKAKAARLLRESRAASVASRKAQEKLAAFIEAHRTTGETDAK